MFADSKSYQQALFLLQSDNKQTRLSTLQQIEEEIHDALLSVEFNYINMMQLWKAFWFILYKEDKNDLQESIAQRIAQLIHKIPTQKEFFESYGLNENVSDSQEVSFQSHQQLNSLEERQELEENEEFEEFEENEELEEMEEQEEQDESDEKKQKPNDFFDDQIDYRGFSSLFLQCGLETFIREMPTVDHHRMSKFLLLVRKTVYESLLFAVRKGEIQNVCEKFDQLVFNFGFVKSLRTPTNLLLHVLDVWNDALRYVLASAPQMDHEDLKMLMLPVLRFTTDVPPDYADVVKTLEEDVLNDFTDPTYPREKSLARLLVCELDEDAITTTKMSDYSLQDVALAIAAGGQHNKELLEQFAQQLQEFFELFQTPEYDACVKQDRNDLEDKEANYVISRENVRTAKRRHGKDWRSHVFKQDGVVQYTKENVLVQRYEDDYLPKKYLYLEKEQRDVGEWDDIDDDGFDVK